MLTNQNSSELDGYLQKFTFENLSKSIPELSEKDFFRLIDGRITNNFYKVDGMDGKLSLSIDKELFQHTLSIYKVEKFIGIPEIVNNKVLNPAHIEDLQKGKKVLIGDEVIYLNKEKTDLFKEKLSNYSLPEAIGNEAVSNKQRVKLLNGESIVTSSNISVKYNNEENNCSVNPMPKGLGKTQKEFLENYQAKFLFSSEKEKIKLNQGLIKKYQNEIGPAKVAELSSKENRTKNLNSAVADQLINNNKEKTGPKVIRKNEKKESVMDAAQNKKSVFQKLSLTQSIKGAANETKSIIHQMTSSM